MEILTPKMLDIAPAKVNPVGIGGTTIFPHAMTTERSAVTDERLMHWPMANAGDELVMQPVLQLAVEQVVT